MTEGGEEAGEVAIQERGNIETEARELCAFDDPGGVRLAADVLAVAEFEPVQLAVEEAQHDVIADARAAVDGLLGMEVAGDRAGSDFNHQLGRAIEVAGVGAGRAAFGAAKMDVRLKLIVCVDADRGFHADPEFSELAGIGD